MKQNVKITKREIKEDKFTTFVLVAKDYVTGRWTYFAAGAAAILVIIVGTALFRSHLASQDRSAADVYNRALAELRTANYQLAIVDFKTVIDQYGSSQLAELAAFNLGNANYGAGNFAEAKTAFETYLNDYTGDRFYVTSAMAGIAACHAGMGELKVAADKYREAAEKYPDFKLAGEYYLKALEYYIKGNEIESAKVILAKLTKEFENTRYYVEGTRLAAEHNLRL